MNATVSCPVHLPRWNCSMHRFDNANCFLISGPLAVVGTGWEVMQSLGAWELVIKVMACSAMCKKALRIYAHKRAMNCSTHIVVFVWQEPTFSWSFIHTTKINAPGFAHSQIELIVLSFVGFARRYRNLDWHSRAFAHSASFVAICASARI